MLKKLDRYILGKLFTTFLFCMLLFTVIAVAVDSSEKTDDFVKTGLSTFQIIKQYYFGFVPWIWGLLFPLFVFIAVIFFTSKMAGRSEIIAIIASGTSFNRFLRPYFLGGLFLGLILWYANRYTIPKANEVKSVFQFKYLDGNDPGKNRNYTSTIYKRADTNTYIGIRNYDTASKYASGFFLEEIKDGKLVYNLRAESIKWDTAAKAWKLNNAVERKLNSMTETIKLFPDTIIKLNIKPEELKNDDYLKDKLTTPQLISYIKKEELRANEGLNALKVEWYRRTATSFSVLLLTIIGAIMASRKTRGGSGLHIALGIIIASFFILADRFSTVFSIKGNFHPALAAWVPNILFGIVAWVLYRKAPK